ncbi:MAG: acyltransferase [Pseudomonadota bacterium]|nr:acyltransferase [Pseudomonadota bacterium]
MYSSDSGAEMQGSKKRYVLLDGMRGIAALAVVVMHHFTSSIGFFRNSAGAVDFFFILSGFVIFHAYERKRLSTIRFMAIRIARLYPLFLIGLILGAPVIFFQALQAHTSLIDVYYILSLNMFYIPYFGKFPAMPGGFDGIPIFPENNPAWSLFFELCANALFFKISRLSLRKMAVGAVLCGLAYPLSGYFFARYYHVPHLFMILGGWGQNNFITGFPRVAYGFVLGMAICKYVNTNLLPKFLNDVAEFKLTGPLIIISFIIFLAMPLIPKEGIIIYLSFIFIFCPIAVMIASQIEITDLTSRNLMEFLGRISYPIYCIHIPIMDLTMMVANKFGVAEGAKFLSITISILLAVLLDKFYDPLARGWLQSLFGKASRVGLAA